MAGVYKHSATFGSLKAITEGIQDNLTSQQYLATLSLLLRHGLELIHQAAPAYLNNFAAKTVAAQTLKPATKFSMNVRGTLPHHLFNLLTTGDVEHFNKMNLNRGILFGILASFVSTVNTYIRVQEMDVSATKTQEATLLADTQAIVGLDPRYNLYAVAREVRYWEHKAQWFKSLIVQKYVRMALLQAQTTYKSLSCSLSLDDISQIYLMYVSKSIDRCDARQGVLTTFIAAWLKSAKADAARQAKESYHASYEELVEAGDDFEVPPNLEFEAMQHISAVAKRIDPEGYVRAPLGIPEFLPSRHQAVLKSYVQENKT